MPLPAATTCRRASSTAIFQAPVAGPLSRSRQRTSDIETKEADVAVLDEVVSALEPHLAPIPCGRVRPRRLQVVEGDNFRLDESALDVAVNHAGRLRRAHSLPHGPGPNFRVAGR